MFKSRSFSIGLKITKSALCDFDKLIRLDNKDILTKAGKQDERLVQFLATKMGIQTRYWVPDKLYAIDLARQALANLLQAEPTIAHEADFLIFCGISNSLPTVCHASLLANEYAFKQASCFDLKSGCSSGVLGLIQALFWLNHGAKKGVIVCAESLSKFTDPTLLQMSGVVGDGATAVVVEADPEVEVLSVLQGTDATHFKTMYVKEPFPPSSSAVSSESYRFSISDNALALQRSEELWNSSLQESLSLAQLKGSDISNFYAHQFDGVKLKAYAQAVGIGPEAVYDAFTDYGNIGCPSVFLAFHQNKTRGQTTMFHAVGGGQSWASVVLKEKGDR
jgi:3-oxoacyl-[acyl-carrier-protein] synthase III